jgi:hypothetical protein
MCRESTRRGERRKPVKKDPAIKASWKIRSGVGRRYVFMKGVVTGHIYSGLISCSIETSRR